MISSGSSSPQTQAAVVRLDSWKEIAAYLCRGVRTAKRWEAERALPVHRLPGGRGSVYAFPAELDQWLTSTTAEGPEKTEEPQASGETGREADAAGSTAQPQEAEAPPVSANLPASSAAGKVHRRFRPVHAYGILVVCLVIAVGYLVNLRTRGEYASSILHSLTTKSALTVSSADRRLAHELYLRGRFEWNQRTPDSLNRALDDFMQSLVHDPSSAPTYVGLADTYNLLREFSLMPENEAFSRSVAASRKAVELDDSLAEAHRALAFDEFYGNWDFSGGEKEFRRAIELNPRDPIAHLWFANAFAGTGWYSFCLHEVDRAQELDPASPAILADKGMMLVEAGQTEEGLELLRQVERTDPGFLSPHRYLARAYLTMRQYPDFLLESEKTAELTGDPVLKETTAAAREGYRRSGERGLLHNLYGAQKRFYDQGRLAGEFLAKTCVRLGRKEEALQLLHKDLDRREGQFLNLRSDGVLTTLKDEPAYQQLLEKIHFPAPESNAATYLASRDSAPADQAAR